MENNQHSCAMTEVINEIKNEQVEQKISLVTLTGEVTRLVTAVGDLVKTQSKDKDKKIDGMSDLIKSLILVVAGFALSKI